MGILRTDRVSGLGGANAITGSVFFSGDGSSGTTKGTSLNIVDANDKADLNFAGNEFTFEAWVFPSNNISWNLLYAQSWPFQIYIDTSSTGFVKVYVGSNDTGSYAISGAQSANGTINADAWNHVAFSRSGNSWTIFTNGTAATSSTSSQSLVSSNADYTIGIFNSIGSGNDAGSYFGFNGYISNLRIRTGAHYLPSTNFTPPVGELQKTSDTVLLACQSPGDITKEATGKTLVPTSKNLNDALPQASHFTPNSPVGFSTTTDVGTQFGSTFDGVTTFDSQAYMVPPGGNTRERNRGRGIIAGGCTPTISEIDFFNIQSQGNSSHFGHLSTDIFGNQMCSSSTRGISGGGAQPTILNILDFITIATESDSTDFGDLTAVRRDIGALSNETRGIWTGGNPGSSPNANNIIDFVTIASLGNATDFGDLTTSLKEVQCASSPTRGIMGGGSTVPANVNAIQFITIASTGNASDFGDLTRTAASLGAVSNGTRGVFANGGSNTIDFVTIASSGNATDFGDSTLLRSQCTATMSNSIRGVFAGGYQPSPNSTDTNTVDFIEIATTGNAQDFGDISRDNNDGNRENGGCSDSHGGIS